LPFSLQPWNVSSKQLRWDEGWNNFVLLNLF
jgi:hypothetical protein